jgi:hypothetical protein
MHRRQLGFSSPHLSLLILYLELDVRTEAQKEAEGGKMTVLASDTTIFASGRGRSFPRSRRHR